MKSTLLRSMNRMNIIDSFSIKGNLFDENIYDSKIDVTELRKSIGIIFQKPNPFPKSIYENIWGPKINGFEGDKDKLMEESLQDTQIK